MVQQVKTGEVLACASYPTFDLSTYRENFKELSEDEYSPLYNRALLAAYPPGSIYKMVTAIFTSVSRVTSDDTTGRVLRYAIKHDISIICMHTNADCAEGGVNDALASALFLTNVVSMEAGENGMLGRVGDLPREMQPREFALYVKECLRAGGVRFCDGGKPITRVAVGGGACGKLMDYAVAGGAQAFVIGDCSYDLMQRAQAIGLSLVDAGHFPTENPVAAVFADKITAAFPQVLTEVSERHADCIQFV